MSRSKSIVSVLTVLYYLIYIILFNIIYFNFVVLFQVAEVWMNEMRRFFRLPGRMEEQEDILHD